MNGVLKGKNIHGGHQTGHLRTNHCFYVIRTVFSDENSGEPVGQNRLLSYNISQRLKQGEAKRQNKKRGIFAFSVKAPPFQLRDESTEKCEPVYLATGLYCGCALPQLFT